MDLCFPKTHFIEQVVIGKQGCYSLTTLTGTRPRVLSLLTLPKMLKETHRTQHEKFLKVKTYHQRTVLGTFHAFGTQVPKLLLALFDLSTESSHT